jgi:hypothetical protein
MRTEKILVSIQEKALQFCSFSPTFSRVSANPQIVNAENYQSSRKAKAEGFQNLRESRKEWLIITSNR